MNLFIRWLISALAVGITALLLPGVSVSGFFTALTIAAVIALINIFLKPILVLLTLPITLLTLGLFLIVIDAVLILIASAIVPGFAVAGFWSALFFAIILSIVNSILSAFEK